VIFEQDKTFYSEIDFYDGDEYIQKIKLLSIIFEFFIFEK